MAATAYDRRGIPIERGDVVRVHHFTDGRRKKHFMYKQCLGAQRSVWLICAEHGANDSRTLNVNWCNSGAPHVTKLGISHSRKQSENVGENWGCDCVATA